MKEVIQIYYPKLEDVKIAAENLSGVVLESPLPKSMYYSKLYNCNVFFKREDLQQVRSYKIRGAYHKISSLSPSEKESGITCASAGNHAQGVALSCKLLSIKAIIFMPRTTPKQKIEQVQFFGEEYIDVVLEGDNYDEARDAALLFCKENNQVFVNPFDDKKIIEGQATVGLEILKQTSIFIDYVFVPVGGGGLSAGLSSVFKSLSPQTKIIGVEPKGAPAMHNSIKKGESIPLETINNFVDGAAVKNVGGLNFQICKKNLDDIVLVDEGHICQTILDLYNKEALVVEPAGAMSLTGLSHYTESIEGKNVVCIISGSNNDISRTAEIKERALMYSNLKHYFIVKFPQRAGALREFVAEILGPSDDITHFEYTKKTNRQKGSAVVGIELKQSQDLEPLIAKMKANNFYGEYLNNKSYIFDFIV
ncbi:threonine ammonia-lyase IlvA [Winogradskyella haliclonae]|uniref:L-threonine dehydratase n=1 Tax=Winogradskyella haliclonae TaxID=2048558 RepID=A0ABQ2BWT4_9FLAO|nr:threonine ammonia-lyase IlvA [Winogradskyella haliclonae]GGI56188.1 L-threonine dehydratase [Winogradskyella haliclonae]